MDAASSSLLEYLPQQFRQFTISEIQSATKNFDESLVIGRGGFGMVYKGTITNGATHLVAAIKRLDSTSNQGEIEFRAEVEMLSKLRHCHLVSLIGYCNDGKEMILVYDYMPHGTLADHLHKFQSPLPWVRRLKICIGAARGLDYLHTGTGIKHGIIHRDVKSSNILLDDSWAAKISDFGLSKLGPINQPSTYVNTFVKGTFGYLDPDYYATGRLTRKSDVYAFGVVLFEVLSGKQAVDSSLDDEHWGLVNWVQESIREGRLSQIVDSYIKERILPKCLKEFARFAEKCFHNNPKQRPTMAEVVICLESILALQEKANYPLHPPGIKIFGNKVPIFLSSFSEDKSDFDKERNGVKMGKASGWFKALLGMKKDKENVDNRKEKEQWSFGKPMKESSSPATVAVATNGNPLLNYPAWMISYKEQNKHAIAIAAATAAAADAAVMRLTRHDRGTLFIGGRERWAAVKIQTMFRGHLARKALRASKGLVKLQAVVRGFLVRKRAAKTLYSIQALLRAQAVVRSQRARQLFRDHQSQPETMLT